MQCQVSIANDSADVKQMWPVIPTYHSWMLLRGETATQRFTAGQRDQTKPNYIGCEILLSNN